MSKCAFILSALACVWRDQLSKVPTGNGWNWNSERK